MKKIYIITIFLVCTGFIFVEKELLAQSIDGEWFKVEYIATVNGESTTGVLHQANNLSVYNWFQFDRDSIEEHIDMGKMNFEINIINHEGLFVCKQFSNDKMFSKERSILTYYYVTDSIPAIDWTIYSDEKIVGDYKSIKAKGFFRGRNYIVWFTPEIPISNGPWKLGGLPGLILEATDEEGRVQFQFLGKHADTMAQTVVENKCYDNNLDFIKWNEYITKAKEDIKQFEGIVNERAGATIRLNTKFIIEKSEFSTKDINE